MMLKGVSRKRLNLYFLAFVSIVGFGLLLVSRFNATNIIPASNAVNGSSQSVQAEPMQPTDKTELVQTDLMGVEPSQTVANAEQTMPARGTPGYLTACQKMKQLYASDRSNKIQAENSRFAGAEQEITNKYHKEGRSFSPAEKNAHARELKRHEGVLQHIESQYQGQVHGLRC